MISMIFGYAVITIVTVVIAAFALSFAWFTLKDRAEKRAKAMRLKAIGIAADRLIKHLSALPQEGDVEGFAPETKAQIHLRESYVARRLTPEESAEARKAWGLQAEIEEMIGKVKEGDPR